MAELCLGSKPLHRLSVQEHPTMFGRVVKGGLDQFLADPFVLMT